MNILNDKINDGKTIRPAHNPYPRAPAPPRTPGILITGGSTLTRQPLRVPARAGQTSGRAAPPPPARRLPPPRPVVRRRPKGLRRDGDPEIPESG